MKRAARTWLFHGLVILAVLAAAGLGVSIAGIVPIKASSGHWWLTARFLQFSKTRSVATHTLAMDAPRLEEPWLASKGAGHYESGCRPCHGSPEFREPVIARSMTPRPPYLGQTVRNWEASELFYIVKHGIKFTGMPAWPALQRDDEVRAMVAFLLKLPDLDAKRYRELVHGEQGSGDPLQVPLEDMGEPAPPIVRTSCARCHGQRGEGRGSAAFPKLAGQTREYLFNALEAYATGRRPSGVMQPVAAPLEGPASAELAEHYSRLAPALPNSEGAPAVTDLERGRDIAMRGIRAQGVPSCADCHGPSPGPRNPAYPRLAGQYADYLVLQLELFERHLRGGSEYAHIMENVASRLQPEQMRSVARYYASLALRAEVRP
jgi:cytochrome c553